MNDLNPRFIIIDDEEVNNIICRRVITKPIPSAEVIMFTSPESGLAYILENFNQPVEGSTILLLDINMPTMSGWKFMDRFEQFPSKVKDQIKVYILSSSIDPIDQEKAEKNPLIIDFLEKPLSTDDLKKILGVKG